MNTMASTYSLSDYYLFGMPMPSRTFTGNGYRFGFQNQETENEIWGEGNASFFKYRISDNRLGRFFSVDPLATKYPHNSTYAFSENSTIAFIELEGLERYYYYNAILKVNGKPQFVPVYSHTIYNEMNPETGKMEEINGEEYLLENPDGDGYTYSFNTYTELMDFNIMSLNAIFHVKNFDKIGFNTMIDEWVGDIKPGMISTVDEIQNFRKLYSMVKFRETYEFRFDVIVGSYSSKENAIVEKERLSKRWKNVTILEPEEDGGNYRVSVYQSNKRGKALFYRNIARSSYETSDDSWLYTRLFDKKKNKYVSKKDN